MKNFSELTNYEKINVSIKDVGLTEEQILELHVMDSIISRSLHTRITDISFAPVIRTNMNIPILE